MGYGYAIWILLTEPDILNLVDENNANIYYPHVTIRCNLTYSDAKKLYKDILDFNSVLFVDTHSGYEIFDFKYKNEDEHAASGVFVDVESWEHLQKISKRYNGSDVITPHITLAYRDDIDELPLHIELSKRKISGKVVIANTTSDDPEKWTLLT